MMDETAKQSQKNQVREQVFEQSKPLSSEYLNCEILGNSWH